MSSQFLTQNSIWRITFYALLVIGVNLWACWPVIGAYFIGDDFGYVQRFNQFPLLKWPTLFTRDWSGGMWGYDLPELRPFAALSFLLDIHLWGVEPLGFHISNAVIAIICAFVVGLLVWRLTDRDWLITTAAAVTFSLHPAHAEPLGWITGRVDLLGTLFYLIGFIGVLFLVEDSRRLTGFGLTWSAYFAGVFTKEFCLTLPILVGLYLLIYRTSDIRRKRADVAILYAGYIIVFFAYWLCRRIAFGDQSTAVASIDLLAPSYMERQISYWGWMIPVFLDLVREQRDLWLPQCGWLAPLCVGLVVSIFGLWRWRTNGATLAWRAGVFFGLCWYAVATLPLVTVGYFSPRHLFFATAGLIIAASMLLHFTLFSRWAKFFVVVVTCLFLGSKLRHEIRPWMRAAKVSQEITNVLSNETPNAETVWILDLPDTFDGCWVWSWSVPFSLRPPFLQNSPGATVENPALYYALHLWAQHNHYSTSPTFKQAILFSFTPPKTVRRSVVPMDKFREAVLLLEAGDKARSEQAAWNHFLAQIRSDE